jgi:hypothetical protein
VKIVDTGTRSERTAVSGTDGAFVFAGLQAATYRLSVSATGFQTAIYENVVILCSVSAKRIARFSFTSAVIWFARSD